MSLFAFKQKAVERKAAERNSTIFPMSGIEDDENYDDDGSHYHHHYYHYFYYLALVSSILLSV